MTIDPSRFSKLLGEFKLEQLFNELGWDQANLRPQDVVAEGGRYTLTSIAQKRGVVVFRCSPDTAGNIPPRTTLLKIEKEATKLAHEHLLVFANAAQTALTWLWVARVPGQPNTTRTHTWHKGTSGESLRQKLNQIVWAMEEEEAITLTDVIRGLRNAFDRDRVSRAFYDRFKTEHEAFSDFIDGIDAATDQAWYASLMLNRLMFVYFIQQKGFLDGNPNYLADRMQAVREKAGKGKFHTFYRQFLRRLFHEGLGQHKKSRGIDLATLIGDVPYLNGGLFDVHELEVGYPDIDIPDEAFQRLFTFFDAYDWHLDDRPLASGSEINPDVLGYIFEKYINQKQMGAYYTKEDITEYISKNTVIPHLIEQARERCKVAFDGDSSVWSLLKADPDRYIYPAMKTGVVDASGKTVPVSVLPGFVQTGMNDPKARMFERRYNLGEAVFHVAASNGQTQRGTLPTETWREYVERRSRCLAVRNKLASGAVKSADDLITLNLDIRQFMQDLIDTCTSPDLLRAVWQAIVGRVPERANEKFRHGIAILDPTCGSGAFLFAALNVLEPLYEACLDRMEGFVEDAKKLGKAGEADFSKVLEEVGHHHSRSYFIYKNIILHNLFGVDIMAEAVEICKLRLFLKLVSQVGAGRELEPLPDIDFNIRAGNTLVGYATEAQFDAANTLASDQSHRAEIKASTADLADAFDFFRQQQTVHGGKVTAEDKRKLRDKLNGLSLELDRYLAQDYGVNPNKKNEFAAWRVSHQPFHWFAEFYGVMREGGFDVVIGNPPYVEYAKVKDQYCITEKTTESCGNLYVFVLDRSLRLGSPRSKMGMIVPISVTSAQRMVPIQDALLANLSTFYVSNFALRPAALFPGVMQRLSIILGSTRRPDRVAPPCIVFTTDYITWYAEERDSLFSRIRYQQINLLRQAYSIPKVVDAHGYSAMEKLLSSAKPWLSHRAFHGRFVLYYHNAGGYWIKTFDFRPYYRSHVATDKKHTTISELEMPSAELASTYLAVLNSSHFYFFWKSMTDARHIYPSDIAMFPIRLPLPPKMLEKLTAINSELMQQLKNNSKRITYGRADVEQFKVAPSKPLIDQIDRVLAEHYGLDADELDFVVNYDIKYRMGGADEEE